MAQGSCEISISDVEREREFYRYYHPPEPASQVGRERRALPVRPAAPGGSSPERHQAPKPSHDKALTAFCQLGALRLDARRCVISFFDRKNTYILAEATRTLSLKTNKPYDSDDELVWGTCIFPRGGGICDYTIKLPSSAVSEVLSFVVNDLSKDSRFSDKAYVAGEPHCRFYAGVPIRSPNGHNIGSYCVIDDKPRDGIIDDALSFMKDMADTVMRHLEMTKTTDNHRRTAIMVTGLGSFVEGRETLEDLPVDSRDAATARSPRIPSLKDFAKEEHSRLGPGRPQDAVSASSGEGASTAPTCPRPDAGQASGRSAVAERSSGSPAAQGSPSAAGLGMPSGSSSSSERTLAQGKETGRGADPLVSPDVKSTFTRAANIIREATEVDGAVFFDASASSFTKATNERLVTVDVAASGAAHGRRSDASTASRSPRSPIPPHELTAFIRGKPCGIFAASSSRSVPEQDAKTAPVRMTEELLQHLHHTYPRGKIFNFDEIASPSSPEREASEELSTEAELLRKIFPLARNLAFAPLWEPHRKRWFAGVVIWTSDSMRVFTLEGEQSYLAAFGNSVMAEIARLDVKMADRAKGNFISSISHELRSPLHGILGSTELLKDTGLNSLQAARVHTIDTCGKTLLDTINHVLDFAKINNLMQGSRAAGSDAVGITSDIDLSVLTEEVLETVFAGHAFQRGTTSSIDPIAADSVASQPGGSTPRIPRTGAVGDLARGPDRCELTVIVDIQKRDNWVYNTQPGAWRRILMNLFGNALKYTDAGFIRVELEAVQAPPKEEAESWDVTLTVSDSGRGMSKEYLRDRLFHPFAQEDPLSPGTGLGLSIIRNIVASLGGSIAVQSEQGKGTQIKVVCPLEPAHARSAEQPASSQDLRLQATANREQGLTVRLCGFDTQSASKPASQAEESAISLLRLSLARACTDWLGMTVLPSQSGAEPSDLFITPEMHLRSLSGSMRSARGSETSPVIVVCAGASSTQPSPETMTSTWTSRPRVQYVSQPCGPRKLAKAIALCIRHRFTDAPELSTSIKRVASTESAGPRLVQGKKTHFNPPMARWRGEYTLHRRKPQRNIRYILAGADGKGFHIFTNTGKDIAAAAQSNFKGVQGIEDTPRADTAEFVPSPDDKASTGSSAFSLTPDTGTRAASPPSTPFSFAPGPPNPLPKRIHVLLVDDNPINLAILISFMDRLDHSYATATNGQEAVTTFQNSPRRFDFVLMDMLMPIMDGNESSRAIRMYEKEKKLAPTVLIALTGQAPDAAKREATSSGVNLFLTKPVMLKELRAVLQSPSALQS